MAAVWLFVGRSPSSAAGHRIFIQERRSRWGIKGNQAVNSRRPGFGISAPEQREAIQIAR